MINTALTLAPLQADAQTRLAFGYFANQQAFGEYQTRIDRYNESWQMLGLVYLVQMAHTFWMRDSYVNAPAEDAAGGPRARFDFLVGDDAPLGGLQRERLLGVGGSAAPARAEFQASFRF